MDRGVWQATVHGVARVEHDLATKLPPYIKTPCSTWALLTVSGWTTGTTKANKILFSTILDLGYRGTIQNNFWLYKNRYTETKPEPVMETERSFKVSLVGTSKPKQHGT